MSGGDGTLRAWWRAPGGGREVLLIGYPLMLSQLSFQLQAFVDRLFLSWYSPTALAAAATAVFTVWGLLGVFIGTGEYLTAFVAQYLGAGRPRRVGATMWQGIYFSLLAGVLMAALLPLMPRLFAAAGHAPELRAYEVTYAGILLLGAFPAVLMATLSTFFAGRGQTRVVLFANVLATLVNVVLDWWWIFDHGGRRGYGVAGAAWATVVSQAMGAAVYFVLMMRADFRRDYATLSAFRPELALIKRLLRFGLPTGLQYSLEVLAFAGFLMVVGRLGVVPLAATSIAFNLNGLVFMPMLGLGMGVSALVARHLGAEQPGAAERSVYSGLALSGVYMALWGGLYIGVPRLLAAPYGAGADPRAFAAVSEAVVVLLRFVAFYSIFDMVNVIAAAGLKGAGDTRYPLGITVVLAWVVLLPPAYLVCVVFPLGLNAAWGCATAYVLALGVLMWRRFRRGRWKSLRVIESAEPLVEAA
jgi:MATE family multidrug resistance protein